MRVSKQILAGLHPAPVRITSGRYYAQDAFGPHIGVIAGASAVVASNVLYTQRIVVPNPITVAQLSIHVTTGAASALARVGIYDVGADGEPSTLIVGSGAIDCSGAAGERLSNITDTLLPPGQYDLAFVTNGGIGLQFSVMATSSVAAYNQYGRSSGTDTTKVIGFTVPFTYAALPAAYPTGTKTFVAAMPRIDFVL